jgi:hypothetical protein
VWAAGVRTHAAIALLLGAAARDEPRRSLLRWLRDAVTHRGLYVDSAERLTPVLRDPPSILPAAFVAGRILLSPRAATKIARHAVSGYAVDPTSVAKVEEIVAQRARSERGQWFSAPQMREAGDGSAALAELLLLDGQLGRR